MHQRHFISWIIVACTIIIAVCGYFLLNYKPLNLQDAQEPKERAMISSTSIITLPQNKLESGIVGAGQGGSGGVAIPSFNEFNITSPSYGETWNKEDASKNIDWIYSSDIKGDDVQLIVELVNLDLIAKGRDVGDPDVSLDVYRDRTTVPDSSKGEVAWSLLKLIPESAFYGYHGNSRIVVYVYDYKNSKSYEAASGIFTVPPTPSAPSAVYSKIGPTPLYNVSSSAITPGQGYRFSASVTSAQPNSQVYFFLQRPNYSIKYKNLFVGTTDASGTLNFTFPTDSNLFAIDPQDENGLWNSWVVVDISGSNLIPMWKR